MFNLKRKIALVTGGSQGLGLAIAEGLAQQGAYVILNGRDKKKLASTVKKFSLRYDKVCASPFDVTDTEAISFHLRKIRSEIGEVDILVNNAGIQHRESLLNIDLSDWQRVLDANLTSPFLLARAVAPSMIKRKAGKIINICSITSELGRSRIAPYVSSKGGLKMLTKAMAVEWAHANVQVNGIGPGYFSTKMNTALINNEDFNSWVCNRTPAGRWGHPSELAGTAVFLASRASDFINGQVIYVDGGFLASM